MNGRIIAIIAKKLLHININKDEPRADMRLPDGLLILGILLIIAGIGLAVGLIFYFHIAMIVFSVLSFIIGILAIMCWRNQTIRIISSNQFEYTTFLGNTYTYRFSDITALRVNNDSMTLFVGNKKIHIENIAILEQRLIDAIDEALEKNNEQPLE